MKYLCLFFSLLVLVSCSQNSQRLADSFPDLIDECIKDKDIAIVTEGTITRKENLIFLRPDEFFKKPFNLKDDEKILMKFRNPKEITPPNGWKLVVCLDDEGLILAMGSSTE